MTQPPAPQPADVSPVGVQSPSADSRTKGPSSPPTHPLAKGPVLRPAHYVEGFVREFLRELNFGQGVVAVALDGQRPVPCAGAHGAALPDGGLAGDRAPAS